jgi:hypothetical protein
MTTIRQKKQNDNKNRIRSIVAGMAGAAAITGAAVAATIALKDEKTRKKLENVLVNAKDKVIDYIDTFKTVPNAKKGTDKIKKMQ